MSEKTPKIKLPPVRTMTDNALCQMTGRVRVDDVDREEIQWVFDIYSRRRKLKFNLGTEDNPGDLDTYRYFRLLEKYPKLFEALDRMIGIDGDIALRNLYNSGISELGGRNLKRFDPKTLISLVKELGGLMRKNEEPEYTNTTINIDNRTQVEENKQIIIDKMRGDPALMEKMRASIEGEAEGEVIIDADTGKPDDEEEECPF